MFVLLLRQPRFLLPFLPAAHEAVPVNMHSDYVYTASQATSALDVHMPGDSVPAWGCVHLVHSPSSHISHKPGRICSCTHLCRTVLRLQASDLHLLLQLGMADVLCQNTDGSPHHILLVTGVTCGHVALACPGGCSSRD